MERTIISFDYAIKDILRDKANFDILSGFLTELIEKPVTVQAVLESEGNSSTLDGKVNRLDLKAEIKDGELVVFEIQFFDQIDFLGKILFNSCKAVVEQVSSGRLYDVKKVYSVNITYFSMGAVNEYVFVANLFEFKGIHFDEFIPFSQNLDPLSNVSKNIHPEYFLIFPKVFEMEEQNDMSGKKVEKVRTTKSKFDEWVYVLKNSAVKSEFTAAGIQAAGEKLNVLKMTPQQRAAYEADKQMDMTQKSQLYTAELKGRIQGRAEGEAKGHAEGEATGLEKGREEEREKTTINCHLAGLQVETISTITGLSAEHIIEILKRHNLK